MSSTTTTPGGPQRAARRRRQRLTFDRVSFMAVFLILPLAIFLLFVISPFVQALYYSLTNWTGFSPDMKFVGIDNYVKLFNDGIFMRAVVNNLLLLAVVPVVTIVLALAIATVVTLGGPSKGTVSGLKGAGIYRIVSFFPFAVPSIVIGLIWAQVFDPGAGLLNGMLKAVGLTNFQDFAWLGKPTTAMPASMWVMIWGGVGFYTVLFIAAIKGVPGETIEAARIDGAGRLRTAWSVTLPQMRDNLQTAVVYLGIGALDGFVIMQAMNPQGGPQNSTLVMSQQLLSTAFTKGQFGYATAMGVFLAVVTLLFSAIVFVLFRITGKEDRGHA
ncbi:MAG TPA: sugar ABC transporter permease [Candidatus Lumbricidophila sp.]|nr:sugar ABC transporter permease [Candidatus Lumbricidophila sp.]